MAPTAAGQFYSSQIPAMGITNIAPHIQTKSVSMNKCICWIYKNLVSISSNSILMDNDSLIVWVCTRRDMTYIKASVRVTNVFIFSILIFFIFISILPWWMIQKRYHDRFGREIEHNSQSMCHFKNLLSILVLIFRELYIIRIEFELGWIFGKSVNHWQRDMFSGSFPLIFSSSHLISNNFVWLHYLYQCRNFISNCWYF